MGTLLNENVQTKSRHDLAFSRTSEIPSNTTLPCVHCLDTVVLRGRGSKRPNPTFSKPSARLSDSKARSICDKARRVYHGLDALRVTLLEVIKFCRLPTVNGGSELICCVWLVLLCLDPLEEQKVGDELRVVGESSIECKGDVDSSSVVTDDGREFCLLCPNMILKFDRKLE